MRNYFQAERLKYRRTSLKGITVIMPLITVFLAAWLTHIFFAVDSYNWWYIGLYPGYLGILCGMIGGKDKGKKNHTIGTLTCSIGKIWDAKVLVGIVMSGMSVICMVLLTVIIGKIMEEGFHIQYIAQPSLEMQVLAGVVMWLTTLWQIPFCLFMVQKMGTFLMLVIHMVCYTIMAVILSLTPCFALFPGAITSRLMCPILGVLPNGLLLQPGQMTYSSQLGEMGNLLVGTPAALLWFGLFWWGSRRWFERKVYLK
ncbi:MAG: lantibiotic immunity ABC transporter MutE/EpiE family permease subunit [Lachnospiraceae bacterium]|nr:lantibiotic immunity ABC transporter MutE/EpiE family permease subunit [Lachnospiraceae bacterium]